MRLTKQTYTQDMHCCGPVDCSAEYKEPHLTIEAHDGGGGVYIVLSAREWSMDSRDVDQLATMLHKFLAHADETENLGD